MSYTVIVVYHTAYSCSDPTAKLNEKCSVAFVSLVYMALASHYVTIVHTMETFVPFLWRYIRFL